MSARVLVTGGTGFIGAAVTRSLVERGDQVRVLDNGSRGALRRLAGILDDVDVFDGDIRDSGFVRRATARMDMVVHLAYINGTEHFYHRPELVLDVGIRGMLSVVDACRAEGVGQLVVASSSEVYQTPPVTPTDEGVPLVVPDILNPRFSYGGGKLATELIAVNYGRFGFDRVSIFRPHNIYGRDMGWEHVIPQLAVRAAERCEASPSDPVPFEIQGDGHQTRAFMHIDDCARAIVTVIDRGEHLGIYHVGTPEERSIADVVGLIFQRLGRQPELVQTELPEGSTLRRCPDISRIRALGFEPSISLAEGLPEVVDWYARHRNPDFLEGIL
jgi:nucleoside-diphosphate-sugar epimerase